MRTTDSPIISGLFIQPFKSAGSTSLTEATISRTGLALDHEWTGYDPQARSVITQREFPTLATVTVSIDPHSEELVLSSPQVGCLTLPLSHANQGKSFSITMHGGPSDVYDCGDEAAAWLSEVVNRKDVRIARKDPHFRRLVNDFFTEGQVHEMALQDGFPFHIVTQGTLEAVNEDLRVNYGLPPRDPKTYRHQIEIANVGDLINEPQHEYAVHDRNILFKNVKPCGRCLMINNNPITGVPDFSGRDSLMGKLKKRVRKVRTPKGVESVLAIGDNAVTTAKFGSIIRVGDRVSVTLPNENRLHRGTSSGPLEITLSMRDMLILRKASNRKYVSKSWKGSSMLYRNTVYFDGTPNHERTSEQKFLNTETGQYEHMSYGKNRLNHESRLLIVRQLGRFHSAFHKVEKEKFQRLEQIQANEITDLMRRFIDL